MAAATGLWQFLRRTARYFVHDLVSYTAIVSLPFSGEAIRLARLATPDESKSLGQTSKRLLIYKKKFLPSFAARATHP
jgi:hypothetical protein